MSETQFEKDVRFLEERKSKLQKEIKTRNEKIKELEIELKVYEKIKGVNNG